MEERGGEQGNTERGRTEEMGRGRKEETGRKGEGKRRKWLGRKGGTEEGGGRMGGSQTSKGGLARGREREGLTWCSDILLYFFSHSSNQLRFITAPRPLLAWSPS